MTMGLTSQQQKCFRLIEAGIQSNGIAPSLEELADHMGLRSRSRVHEIVSALEERGHIRRLPNRARAIEVVAGAAPRAVTLNPEIFAAVSAYAREIGKSLDTATNELLRDLLELSA